MECPYCEAEAGDPVRVTETRSKGFQVLRTRKCAACDRTFKTVEHLNEASLAVRNRSGELEPFDRQKIANGIRRAGRLKPISEQDVLSSVDRIVAKVYEISGSGKVEVTTTAIGELVMEQLRTLSPAAHIRYAAVFYGRLDGSGPGFETVDDYLEWITSNYEWLPSSTEVHIKTQPEDVVKKAGRIEFYDRSKIKEGIRIAVRGRRPKRELEDSLAEKITVIVEESLKGQPRVTSGQVGTEVLRALEENGEEVGYIRYASVFKELRQPYEIWLEANALRRRRLGLD